MWKCIKEFFFKMLLYMEVSKLKDKEYLNLEESAEILGVSSQMISKLTRVKDFPCTRLKRRILINKEKLLKWQTL